MVGQQTSLDMGPSQIKEVGAGAPRPRFVPWYGEGQLPVGLFDVGNIAYGTDGCLRVELVLGQVGAAHVVSARQLSLVFSAPLAVRIVQEGSLLEYWNNGVLVRDHNVLFTHTSKLIEWLEASSSGVHASDRVTHYAVFTDDVCIEVLSSVAPLIQE